MIRIGIIGGGAAGFFSAISAKENFPDAEVVIFEKSKKVLSKVKVSGGGRCNVTNGCQSISELSLAYPRGQKMLKKAFRHFNTKHAMEWFENRGVPLVIQEDNCVFPVSQNSQSIIDCFLNECRKLGVAIQTEAGVNQLEQKNDQIVIHFDRDRTEQIFDKVIIATGGSPKLKGLEWLADLGHKIEHPVPSLFTFNMPNEPIRDLMGIVVNETKVSIQGTKLKSDGPLLITHWGMSGPAILKLSAFGARILSEKSYDFNIQVNWVNESNYDKVSSEIYKIVSQHPNKNIANIRPFYLKERLWNYLIDKMGLAPSKKWVELGKKGVNKIVDTLTNDIYSVNGKTTFKEEFVTCGGVSLESINSKTMESKVVNNLYFAGEILDIDGITGGYNFQAAWTTGYIAAQLG